MHNPALMEAASMIPLDRPGEMTELLRAALYNCERFNRPAFEQWLAQRPELRELATTCPPDRIYELRGMEVVVESIVGAKSLASNVGTKHCVLLGYREPNCMVQLIGHPVQLSVPAAALKDITADVRAQLFHDR